MADKENQRAAREARRAEIQATLDEKFGDRFRVRVTRTGVTVSRKPASSS